jgi:hypothetical protein
MAKFGIIIAIEKYSSAIFPPLKTIEFAANDAQSMKTAFLEQLYIDQKNLVFLLNENANKEKIEFSMKDILKLMTSEDECYFYYVGHGFNAHGKNRITCFETDNSLLEESSLSLEEILLTPLKNSQCKKNFLFIDASAEELKSKNKVRSHADNLVEKEYSDLVRFAPGNSIFLSCFPGESSFVSPQAKHGIWTLQLLNAINGKDDGAIDNKNAITNSSLSKFLALKVPQYITKTMFINDRQSPYSVIDSSSSSTLLQFESNDENKEFVQIQFNQYVLSREQNIPFKNFEAFNKGRHKIPKDMSSFASKLAADLAQDEYLKVEIENLFDNARKGLRLKNSNTVKDPEGGSLHTEFFRYNISAFQSESDCSEVTIRRELELRVPLTSFPIPLDNIFTDGFDTITFPIKGALDVDSLEDALYELEDEDQGSFEHKENIFSFFPKKIKGISKVEISKSTLKIRFASTHATVAEILDYTEQTLEVMAATLKNLLS